MRPDNLLPLQTARTAAILLLLSAFAASLYARPKTDVLIMRNGDHITCEIRALEKGQLKIKTDYTTGTVPVDWSEVERIESVQYFKVEMQDGRRYSGTIKREPTSAATDKGFVIIDEGYEERVAKQEVVVLDQLDRSWLSNFKGAIDGGFDFTKANNRVTYAVNGSLEYQTQRKLFQATLSSTITRQQELEPSETHTIGLGYNAGLSNNWYWGAMSDFTRSDELNLSLRSTMGGGVGRFFIHTNRTNLRVLGGMVYTIENFMNVPEGDDPTRKSLEGLVNANFDIFRFDSTQATAYINFYPSLTERRRVRAVTGVDFKLDLIGDLYWKLSFWNSVDNKPPEGTSGSDRTFSTTVGWSF